MDMVAAAMGHVSPMLMAPSTDASFFSSAVPMAMSTAPSSGMNMDANRGIVLMHSTHHSNPGASSGSVLSPERLAILDDLRHVRKRNYELFDIAGSIVDFARDQHGSRFIQLKLETTASDADKEMVFEEIYHGNRGGIPASGLHDPQGHAVCLSLMEDVFGNYVVQKLLEFGLERHRQALFHNVMRGHVLDLTLQMYGCRVVQKALECLDAEAHAVILSELRIPPRSIVRCVKDQNGNHVIQKCIECIDSSLTRCIVDAFVGHVAIFSRHAYGCRVVQRILEHGNVQQRFVLQSEIIPAALSLSQDQYGNYVIQHMLEHGTADERNALTERIVLHPSTFLACSRHKFASNVVEKCYTHGGEGNRAMILDVMLSAVDPDGFPFMETADAAEGGSAGRHVLLFAMMIDQFANYVVQKILDASTDAQRGRLVEVIRIYAPALKRYPFGKHILSKIAL